MKKTYESPEFEVFDIAMDVDVICASKTEGGAGGGDWGGSGDFGGEGGDGDW